MLTLEEIREKIKQGNLKESETIEFKTSISLTKDNTVAREIVGVANNGGGYLVVGVQENSKGLIIRGVKDVESIHSILLTINEKYLIGVKLNYRDESFEEKKVVIIEIIPTNVIAYYSRKETSPERQIAYKIQRNSSCHNVLTDEQRMSYKKVYKYMTLESFILNLYSKSWRFWEPNKWNDHFERRFYCADYSAISKLDNFPPQIFMTCVTRKENSEAAWKVYSSGEGLGKHCVQLELDCLELRKQLKANSIKIEELVVDYKDEYEIINLHKCNSSSYEKYFQEFSIKKFLKLLALKRKAYSYEDEIRFYAIPEPYQKRGHGNKYQGKDLKIEWSKVIKKVKIDKACSDAELLTVQQACFFAGINPIFSKKKYTFIGNLPTPKYLVNIEFERFSIDDMPGKPCISIKADTNHEKNGKVARNVAMDDL